MEGDKTWRYLKDWTKGQKVSERLSAHILAFEGYENINPSHPLGGRDNIKDIIAIKDQIKWVAGCYFSKNPNRFYTIKQKFLNDLKGVEKNSCDGFIFITNQELSVVERDQLEKLNPHVKTEIYHLERLTHILNSPKAYGVRLEFLDIELTKSEQLAFFAQREALDLKIYTTLNDLKKLIEGTINSDKIPTDELYKFKSILDDIVGNSTFSSIINNSPIHKLKVPLNELLEFKNLLEKIVGSNYHFINDGSISKLKIPIEELKEFKEILLSLIGNKGFSGSGLVHYHSYWSEPSIDQLKVPLKEIKEYQEILNDILSKQNQMKK